MKNKIKKLIVASALLAGVSSFAGDDFLKDRYENGYTYFSVVSTRMNYTSSYTADGSGSLADGTSVETDATSTNPLYVAGGLYVINDTYDISTEISTTLAPQKADETVSVDGTTDGTNYSDMMSNNIQVLGHYKFSNENRVVFGGTYNLSSYKRYKFRDADGVASSSQVVTEQRSSSLALQIGYWYEGYFLNDSALHLNFRALAGVPVYVKTENTLENTTFSELGGYNTDLYLSVGYKIFGNKEIGALVGYSMQSRSGDKKLNTNPDIDGTYVVLPENKTENMYIGLYVAF